jgi:dTDP-4-dehydrorhamnose reductase
VDGCEQDSEKSRLINVEGTKNVAVACNKYGSKMVFISTDYVFDGEKGDYLESDPVKPLSIYAEHKLEAEKIVLNTNKEFLICRPSVIYGWGPTPNFVTWLIGELKSNKKVNIVNDQFSSPTLADDLADMILSLCEKGASGIFHTTGSDCVNRYDFSKSIAKAFSLDEGLISPITTEELGQKALRPKRCCMNIGKVTKTIGRLPLTSIEGISKMKLDGEKND